MQNLKLKNKWKLKRIIKITIKIHLNINIKITKIAKTKTEKIIKLKLNKTYLIKNKITKAQVYLNHFHVRERLWILNASKRMMHKWPQSKHTWTKDPKTPTRKATCWSAAQQYRCRERIWPSERDSDPGSPLRPWEPLSNSSAGFSLSFSCGRGQSVCWIVWREYWLSLH